MSRVQDLPLVDLPWCAVCGSRHTPRRCPGEVEATGPERHGWRVNVETPSGIEAYGVLVAESHGVWRARIMTYPNVLWLIPGGRGTMKFIGGTPQDAEQQAVELVREHCRRRGYKIRHELRPVDVGAFDQEQAHGQLTVQAERKVRFLPVRFGLVSATELGGTGNLSESGLFIITESPIDTGERLSVAFKVDRAALEMWGCVRWSRKEHHVGRSPGMGVELVAPPRLYIDYIRRLR